MVESGRLRHTAVSSLRIEQVCVAPPDVGTGMVGGGPGSYLRQWRGVVPGSHRGGNTEADWDDYEARVEQAAMDAG